MTASEPAARQAYAKNLEAVVRFETNNNSATDLNLINAVQVHDLAAAALDADAGDDVAGALQGDGGFAAGIRGGGWRGDFDFCRRTRRGGCGLHIQRSKSRGALRTDGGHEGHKSIRHSGAVIKVWLT